MVDNTLDISRVESGLYNINNEVYDLRDILKNINYIASNLIESDKVKFIMDVDSNIPYNLVGDYNKLLKVLSNILSNSAKYTNVGKIMFSISGKVINDSLNLTFKIKDTGIGIKEEDKEKLFKKFDKIENADTKGSQGTGLGLLLSKRIIELLGGTISFESTYGAGSAFIINLSQKINSNEIIGKFDINSLNYDINLFDCSNYRVLIVDENKYSIRALERMLGLYGIKASSVNKLDEYIDLLKTENKYDIIFIGNNLASQDMFKIMQTYKNISNKNLKIIALSDDSLDVSKRYFINEGYDDYLIKPIDLVKINNLLNKFLK